MIYAYVGGAVLGTILIILLIVRRRRRIAQGLPVFYPFKRYVKCSACEYVFYVRRRSRETGCPNCSYICI